MYKFYKDTVVDFDKYASLLRQRPYLLFDKEKMDKTLHYQECIADTYFALAIDEMIVVSSGACTDLSRDVVINYLMNYERCPERYFNNRKTESYSLDSKKVLEKLIQNGHAKDFLEYYMQYKSWVSKNGKIRGILKKSTQPGGVSREGTELTKLFFDVNQQKNFRFNYKDSDVIAIPKEYNDCIGVEDGYFLAWGDFGQSDFRIAYNLFMRSPENDKIMNAYDDKYEALARMVSALEGQQFDYDKFKEERQLYKRLTLATVYGTRDSVVESEQPFIKRMTDFLYTCEKYVEYEQRLKDRIESNLPVLVDSYFHNEQTIANKTREVDLLNDALNTPVQTGTSEIVALTVMAILEEFYKLGYSNEDISVYYVRHDEPIFKVKESCLKDAWIFNQFKEILVDDWTPLRMDFNFGYHYKMVDDELESKIKAVYEKNMDKIVTIPVGNSINDFYPTPPMFKLAVTRMKTSDGAIIYCLYSEKLNAVQYSLLKSPVEDELAYVCNLISRIENNIYENGYRGIVIRSNFIQPTEQFIGKSYVNFMCVNDNTLSKSDILCRYMYCRYSKSHGLDYDITYTPLQSDAIFVNSVSELSECIGGSND